MIMRRFLNIAVTMIALAPMTLPDVASAVVLCFCPDGGAALEIECRQDLCCDSVDAPAALPQVSSQTPVEEHCTDIPIPLGMAWQQGRHVIVVQHGLSLDEVASTCSLGHLPILPEPATHVAADTPAVADSVDLQRTTVLRI